MSDADKRQDEELERNRRTDAWQWAAIFAFALGLTVYVGFVLGVGMSIQGDTIKRLTEIVEGCRK